MDNSSQQRETISFLRKLKSNPVFLLKHVKSLSGMTFRRFYAARSKKRRPNWLHDISDLGANQVTAAMPAHRLAANYTEIPAGEVVNSANDIEDYFAQHRFNQLILQTSMPAAIEQWIQAPPSKSDHAWETYSTCERVANLITWLALQNKIAYTDFIAESMQWIFQHLEFYGDKTNNHLLNNARALVMAGTLLGNDKARTVGLRIFKYMLPVLIQKDGFLRERSSHYQLIILTWLLDAAHFLGNNTPHFLQETINRMRQAASLVCDKSGNLVALVGDISPDATPAFTSWRLRALYPTAWPAITTQPFYDDWHAVQYKKNKIILNAPLGSYPLIYPTHGHNDITSFVWVYEDQPILVDNGRVRYSKEAVAVWQKSGSGHNLPLVNHHAPLCESLVINGNWWPLPYANALIKVHRPNQQSIQIIHDGYKRITPVVSHSREINLLESTICINDYFAGTGDVEIQLLWHLHPSFHCINGTNLFSNQTHEVTINVNPQFKKGWNSLEYARAQNNLVLVNKWTVTLPFTAMIRFEVKKCVV